MPRSYCPTILVFRRRIDSVIAIHPVFGSRLTGTYLDLSSEKVEDNGRWTSEGHSSSILGSSRAESSVCHSIHWDGFRQRMPRGTDSVSRPHRSILNLLLWWSPPHVVIIVERFLLAFPFFFLCLNIIIHKASIIVSF